MSDDNCLDVASPGGPVNLIRCHGMGGNQAWVYDNEVRYFYYFKTNLLSIYLIVFFKYLKHFANKYFKHLYDFQRVFIV